MIWNSCKKEDVEFVNTFERRWPYLKVVDILLLLTLKVSYEGNFFYT